MTYSIKHRFTGESIEVSGRTKDEKIQVHEDYVRNESKLLKLHMYMLNINRSVMKSVFLNSNYFLFLNCLLVSLKLRIMKTRLSRISNFGKLGKIKSSVQLKDRNSFMK